MTGTRSTHEEMRNANSIFVGEMYLTERGRRVDWIQLAKEWARKRALMDHTRGSGCVSSVGQLVRNRHSAHLLAHSWRSQIAKISLEIVMTSRQESLASLGCDVRSIL
jgi:hypothetical protein